MIHDREDYNKRIQDSDGLIPEDEPVFLIRAQDSLAVTMLRSYAALSGARGASKEFVRSVRKQLERVITWQNTHEIRAADIPD